MLVTYKQKYFLLASKVLKASLRGTLHLSSDVLSEAFYFPFLTLIKLCYTHTEKKKASLGKCAVLHKKIKSENRHELKTFKEQNGEYNLSWNM